MKIEDVRFKAKIKGIKTLGEVYTIQYYTDCNEIAELEIIFPFRKEIQKELHNKSFFYYIDHEEDYIKITINKKEDVEALLPYTGFKDKKGEDIYEGDIIEINCRDGKEIGRVDSEGTIFFREDSNVVDGYGDLALLYSSSDNLPCKIIGNCFENPELLKKV